jgi:uncharacterized protein
MNILAELAQLARRWAGRLPVPLIREAYFPPLPPVGAGPVEHEFMLLALEGGAAGLSYVLLPARAAPAYRALRPETFRGTSPANHLAALGGGDPLADMIGVAAVNAICQHVMRTGQVRVDLATDSLGLLELRDGDRLGMVGLFPPLLRHVDRARIELLIVEQDESLLGKFPGRDVTLDVTRLRRCNKVLCTSTAVLNDSIDEVLANCAAAERISVIGPTAGFFPDPLFARGIHVVGGRYVVDGDKLLARMKAGERWGDATEKLCFRKDAYESPHDPA